MTDRNDSVTITYTFSSEYEADEWINRKSEARDESLCWFELNNYLRSLNKHVDLSSEKQELLDQIIKYMRQLEE